jgi:hypothetical protein
MCFEAVTWVIESKIPGGASAKIVLLCLAYHANIKNDWDCWPTIGLIAKETGLNRKTVMEAIKRLLEGGFILNTGKFDGKTHKVVVYKLVPEKLDRQYQKRNSSKNGTIPFPSSNNTKRGFVKQSQIRDTEPKYITPNKTLKDEVIISELKKVITSAGLSIFDVERWFDDVQLEEGILIINAVSPYKHDHIQRNFLDKLKRHLDGRILLRKKWEQQITKTAA